MASADGPRRTFSHRTNAAGVAWIPAAFFCMLETDNHEDPAMHPTRLTAALLFCLPALAVSAKDIAGSKDHPLVGRYQGSEIVSFKSSDFDEQRLLDRALPQRYVGDALDDSNSRRIEGKVMRIRYEAPQDRSSLEIIRNYEESLKGKGFETIFTCANEACVGGDTGFYRFGAAADSAQQNFRYAKAVRYILARKTQTQGDVYAAVVVGEAARPTVYVTAIDLKPMQSGQIQFIDASAMEQAIAAQGRVALYGIEFDTDKAEIRPASRPTLDEMAKFLKKASSMSVIIAGHTDNQGDFAYNVGLSQRRAASVVAALRTRGIAEARLVPFGNGMAAPLADNQNEAGRQKNRRVEMVRR